jgi:FixJ family two-component response regulator
VRTFSSARALLDAGLSRVGCVVTDIGMPSVDGFDLHDLVKKARPDLPVFMITGRDVTGDQQRAIINGVNGFFRKPFDGPTLLRAVGNALRTHGGENASLS